MLFMFCFGGFWFFAIVVFVFTFICLFGVLFWGGFFWGGGFGVCFLLLFYLFGFLTPPHWQPHAVQLFGKPQR